MRVVGLNPSLWSEDDKHYILPIWGGSIMCYSSSSLYKYIYIWLIAIDENHIWISTDIVSFHKLADISNITFINKNWHSRSNGSPSFLIFTLCDFNVQQRFAMVTGSTPPSTGRTWNSLLQMKSDISGEELNISVYKAFFFSFLFFS